MPEHPYLVIRHSKLIFSFFFGLEVFIETDGDSYLYLVRVKTNLEQVYKQTDGELMQFLVVFKNFVNAHTVNYERVSDYRSFNNLALIVR